MKGHEATLAAVDDAEGFEAYEPRPYTETLRAFLDGEDVPHGELREALRLHNELTLRPFEKGAEALELAWDETTALLASLSQQAGEKATVLYDAWNEDEWVLGHMHGEAVTWRATAKTLEYVNNCMYARREAARRRLGGEHG